LVAGGDDSARPRRKGNHFSIFFFWQKRFPVFYKLTNMCLSFYYGQIFAKTSNSLSKKHQFFRQFFGEKSYHRSLRAILNFTPGPQGWTLPLGDNFTPRGQSSPLGRS
jgi:hypothetical protein